LTKLLLEDAADLILQQGLIHQVSSVISKALGWWPHQAVQVNQHFVDSSHLHHQDSDMFHHLTH